MRYLNWSIIVLLQVWVNGDTGHSLTRVFSSNQVLSSKHVRTSSHSFNHHDSIPARILLSNPWTTGEDLHDSSR